ncbi:MAG TPA: nucleotidyl transferase AbiEii/AbiGii toxin family protein [bacterium]|nr:nucleotidyl transferase AbiEii/AbiGii toxin family protein [bacterium]
MEELIQQEKFEIEVLEYLNSKKYLDKMIFVGETMLRLCYGLNRFSVDLDFWIIKKIKFDKFFLDLKNFLEEKYIIKDCANKFSTILFEISSSEYHRNLKIEIRKEIKKIKYEKAIAFSKFSNIQVLLNSIDLNDMMKFKIESFLSRKEIRDCFDIEFLFKRGIPINLNVKQAKLLLKEIEKLKENDYKIKLGSIIEREVRNYYLKKNFYILKMELMKILIT